MAPRTLLELSTDEPARPHITINRKAFALKVSDDLGLREDAEYRAAANDLGEEVDHEKRIAALDRMVRMLVIGIDDATIALLKDKQKIAIINAFAEEALKSRQPASEAKVEAPRMAPVPGEAGV